MIKQEEIFGYNSINEISNLLEKNLINKPFLVCGKSFKSQSSYSLFSKMVKFSSFSSNPKYEDICKGVEKFKEEQCDAIISIGGGSAIDVAKAIKLFAPLNTSIDYVFSNFVDNSLPLISIPTTCGTGSEATCVSVIYYKGEKLSLNHSCLLPSHVILDPQLIESLNTYQKKCTILDSLCQSLESIWSVNATKESTEFAIKACDLILDNIEGALKNYKEANEKVLLAANLSGKAIYLSKTTAPHSMSYKLTTLFDIPHGHSVALCFYYVWQHISVLLKMNKLKTFNEDKRRVEDKLKIIANIFKCNEESVARDRYKSLLKELEIFCPKKVEFENDKNEILNTLVSSVNLDRLKNNPVDLSLYEIEELYIKILNY